MSPLLLALLVWTQAPSAAPPSPPGSNAPAAQRAVVAPLKLGPSASSEATAARDLVEHALSQALARHATFQLLTPSDVAAMLGRAAQQQLSGCDAESCVAEIADALNADLLVSGNFTVTPGLWTLQVSLIERRTAVVLHRAAARSRDLQSLLASVDVVARQLCGAGAVDIKDPNLVARLGTTQAAARELALAAQKTPNQDATAVWTNLILSHNRESTWLALAQGALLLVSGVSFLAAVVLNAALVFTVGRLPTLPSGGPTWAYASSMLFSLPLFLLSAGTLGAALVLLGVDAANPGRVPVDRQGCCRDEQLLRDAEEPTLLDRLGAVLAAGGTLLGAGAPAAGGILFMGLVWGSALGRGGDFLPPENFPSATAEQLYNLRFCLPVCFTCWGCCLGGTGLLVASALAAGTRQDVLDDVPPTVAPAPAKPAAPPPQPTRNPP